VDWKAIHHAIRIGRQGEELFTTGKVVFPRCDADYLVAIKKGQIPFQQCSDEIDELLVKVDELSKTNVFFGDVSDYQFMNDLVYKAYYQQVLS
jgi:hypothetical protein